MRTTVYSVRTHSWSGQAQHTPCQWGAARANHRSLPLSSAFLHIDSQRAEGDEDANAKEHREERVLRVRIRAEAARLGNQPVLHRLGQLGLRHRRLLVVIVGLVAVLLVGSHFGRTLRVADNTLR